MSKSKPRIPKKGKNPAQLEIALDQKNRAMVDAMTAQNNIVKMMAETSRIVGQLVVMFEILKDKGIITHDEIQKKFKDLEAKRKEAEEKHEADAKKEWNKERQALADQSNGKEETDKVPISSEESTEGCSI